MPKGTKPSGPDGFVLVDKPAGMGSAALVAELRRALGGARAGHTGTLDRFASGLMLLLTGRATSLAEFFLHADKSYRAEFRFGVFTDTHDPSGATLASRSEAETRDFLRSNEPRIRQAVAGLREVTEQRPPLYSALKKEGRRYSDHARAGVAEAPPARPVQVYEARLVRFDAEGGIVAAELKVSGGAYIRSFARDLSEQLGFPIHLGGLHRLSIGPHVLPSMEAEADAGAPVWRPGLSDAPPPVIRDFREALPEWPRIRLEDPAAAVAVQQGRFPDLPETPPSGQNFFLEDGEGRALAWARSQRDGYRYKRVFV